PRKAPHRHAREAVSFSDSVQGGGKPSFRVDRPGAVLYRISFVSLTCRQFPTEPECHARAREIQTAPLVLFTSCPPRLSVRRLPLRLSPVCQPSSSCSQPCC